MNWRTHTSFLLLLTTAGALTWWPLTRAHAGPLQDLLSFLESRLGFELAAAGPAAAPSASNESRRPRAGIDHAALGMERCAALPPLQWMAGADIEHAWLEAKRISSAAKQLRAVRDRGLLHRAASDLQPVTDLVPAFQQVYQRRDRWRDRTHARPEMMAVLGRAAVRMAQEMPGVRITIGDVAQPGAGQIAYGVTVRILRDDALRSPLSDILASATWRDGAWVASKIVDPSIEFEREFSRFAAFDSRVLLENTVLATEPWPADAAAPLPAARIETRRYYEDKQPSPEAMATWWARTVKAWSRAELAESSAVATGVTTSRRVRLIHGAQLLELWLSDAHTALPKVRGRWSFPPLDAILEIRTGHLDRKKPGVVIQEVRYRRQEAIAGASWQKWKLLYEATHISHMGGLDADLSYVTDEPQWHFSKEIQHIDVASSLRWIQILAASAQDVGVRIDKILIDPRVLRLLQAGMPAGEPRPPYWEFVAASKGHDSHLHIRLHPGFARMAGTPDESQEPIQPATPAAWEP